MSNQHKALGRGIGALIPGAAPASSPALVAESGPTRIPLDSIEPNPDQPRRVFDPKDLERMAKSVSRHGVLQPVIVRKAGHGYQLICGERRWRAARLAGLSSISAVVTDVDDRDRLELALIENVQRADLNPIELAYAFKALCGRQPPEDARAATRDSGRRRSRPAEPRTCQGVALCRKPGASPASPGSHRPGGAFGPRQ